MKKLYFCLPLVLIICACAGTNNKIFSPDLKLIEVWSEADHSYSEGHSLPYLSVFKKDGKTLVYLAARHSYKKTNAFADYVFEKYKPQVAVVEIERTGRALNPYVDAEWEGNHRRYWRPKITYR